jgi:hypothetical protein
LRSTSKIWIEVKGDAGIPPGCLPVEIGHPLASLVLACISLATSPSWRSRLGSCSSPGLQTLADRKSRDGSSTFTGLA